MTAQTDLQSSEAFAALALPYLNELYRSARHTLGNEAAAEDVVQETYLQAWRSFHRFEPGTNLRAWLFKILFHVVSHQRRKWLRFDWGWTARDEARWEETLVYQPPVTPHLTDQEIIAALGRLPEAFQAVLLLAVVEEFTYKESAEILQIPVGTVMSRLYRARKMLARELQKSARAQPAHDE